VAPTGGMLHNGFTVAATGTRREKRVREKGKAKPETPWNVILHNDWENSMPRVMIVLKKVIPGMTLKRAAKIMWEAHSKGRAVVKSCHRELAELYEERLRQEGLTVSTEKAG
jgi:ATP-dependent Clp protease adaptor protein ClpS